MNQDDEINFKQYSDLIQRKLIEFIEDMRELGQTEISAIGPGYEIDLKITPKEKQ